MYKSEISTCIFRWPLKTLNTSYTYESHNVLSVTATQTVFIQVAVKLQLQCSIVLGYQHFRGPYCLHLQSKVHVAGRRT